MAHDFDPGYNREPFRRLVNNYPGIDAYPVADFRTEWGPVFHRGRLDGTARVVVIGQDPATHEAISRRILVGEAGQRVQGLLAKLGLTESYVLVNAFLYSVYGQGGGARHEKNAAIAAYRNKWFDALIPDNATDAVIALGQLANSAYQQWKLTPTGLKTDVAYAAVRHPTYPESSSASGQTTKAEAMKKMLETWNDALKLLHPEIRVPDVKTPLELYGTDLLDTDVREIPEGDLPAGTPAWMRSLRSWATRVGEEASEKRATIRVRVPKDAQEWTRIEP